MYMCVCIYASIYESIERKGGAHTAFGSRRAQLGTAVHI